MDTQKERQRGRIRDRNKIYSTLKEMNQYFGVSLKIY
jgi:hypothetical protein